MMKPRALCLAVLILAGAAGPAAAGGSRPRLACGRQPPDADLDNSTHRRRAYSSPGANVICAEELNVGVFALPDKPRMDTGVRGAAEARVLVLRVKETSAAIVSLDLLAVGKEFPARHQSEIAKLCRPLSLVPR